MQISAVLNRLIGKHDFGFHRVIFSKYDSNKHDVKGIINYQSIIHLQSTLRLIV